MPAATRAQAGATPIAEDLGAREGLRHSAPPQLQSLFKGDAEKDERTGKRRASLAQSQDDIDAGRPAVGDEGGVGGQTDLLDPGEARFWRALPGEGDGTYVARAAALAHPVLRCFVWLHSLEHPAEEGLAPITVGHRLLFDSALVPVWSRADRADRTVSPAVCSQVKRAVDP